jgi:hypothetical protein
MLPRRALVIDPGGIADTVDRAEAAVRAAFPELVIDRVDATEPQAMRNAASDANAWWVLPFRLRYLARAAYLRLFAFSLLRVRSRVGVIGPSGIVLHPLVPLLSAAPFLHPLVSLVVLLTSPWFLLKGLVRDFLFTSDSADDPIVGYGRDRDVGGVMYWTLIAEKAKRYGVFGLAHDNYWGKPLSVHSWPLAVAALRFLGYRLYTIVAVALFSLAYAYVAVSSGHTSALGFLPLIFVSTYFAFNLYCGTWELLAWGLGALALAAMWAGQPVIAGAFVGAAILAHPGAGALSALLVSAGTLAWHRPFLDLVIAGIASIPVALPFLVPYWRTRAKLGRGQLLNEAAPAHVTADVAAIYTLATFVALAVAAWLTTSWRSLALFAIPIVVQTLNTFVVWVFSKYTVFNMVLVAGGIQLALHPAPLYAVVYLLVIFTSPMMLIETSYNPLLNFDLTPLRLGDSGHRLRALLGNLTDGRVAFEHDGFNSEMAYATATVARAVARQPVSVLNAAYTEIGDAELFRRFVKPLHPSSTRDEVLASLRASASRYVVAYSDAFRTRLREFGLRELGEERGLRISHFVNRPPMTATLFDLGEPVSLIEPPVPLTVSKNAIDFDATAGVSYLVRFTAFRGWAAEASGVRIPIEDARPGIRITAPTSGPVRLRYRFANYFR